MASLIDLYICTALWPGCSQMTASELSQAAIEAEPDGFAVVEYQKVEFGNEVSINHKQIAEPEVDGSEEG